MSKQAGWGVMASHRRYENYTLLYGRYLSCTGEEEIRFDNYFCCWMQWRDRGHFHSRSIRGFGYGNVLSDSKNYFYCVPL